MITSKPNQFLRLSGRSSGVFTKEMKQEKEGVVQQETKEKDN